MWDSEPTPVVLSEVSGNITHCLGCLNERTFTVPEGSGKWWSRPRREKIRVNEDICWRDKAINDFTGNLSGIVGMKKHLHLPNKRTPIAKRLNVHSRRKQQHSKGSTNQMRPMRLKSRTGECRTGESIDIEISQERPYLVIDDDKIQVTQSVANNGKPITPENVASSSNSNFTSVREYIYVDDDVIDEHAKQHIHRPVVSKIRTEIPQKPTEELELSSDEDDYLPVPDTSTLGTPALKSNQQTDFNRLFSDENLRPRKGHRHLEQIFGERSKTCQGSGDFWDTRGDPLLGYDFVAGSVDNLKFLGRPPRPDYSEMKEFRKTNANECSADNYLERREQSRLDIEELKYTLDSDHCVHSYRLNERLFAEPQHEADRKGCSICSLLLDYDLNRPRHVSLNVPAKLQHYPKQKLSKNYSRSNVDSLALLQNCEFCISR